MSGNAPSNSWANLLKPSKKPSDELLFLLANLVGLKVEVFVDDGIKYVGIFHAAHVENGLSVCLRMAQMEKKIVPYLVLEYQSISRIIVPEVDFGETESSDINKLGERALQKWVPEQTNPTSDMELLKSDTKGWDQFEANEKLFGVKTDFEEDLYTVPLDKNSEIYKKKEKYAAKLAKEIEKTPTTNIHQAEERGATIREKEVDEEDKYGAVIRKKSDIATTSGRGLNKKSGNSSSSHASSLKADKLNKKRPVDRKSSSDSGKSRVSDKKPLESGKGGKHESNKDENTSVPSSTLNPLAAEFKFNLDAPEFMPAAPPDNVFQKYICFAPDGISAILYDNFMKNDNRQTISKVWPYGQQSYKNMLIEQQQMYFISPYGYPYPYPFPYSPSSYPSSPLQANFFQPPQPFITHPYHQNMMPMPNQQMMQYPQYRSLAPSPRGIQSHGIVSTNLQQQIPRSTNTNQNTTLNNIPNN